MYIVKKNMSWGSISLPIDKSLYMYKILSPYPLINHDICINLGPLRIYMLIYLDLNLYIYHAFSMGGERIWNLCLYHTLSMDREIWIYMNVCMYICIYECMYVFMYVCMYICIYIYIYIYVCVCINVCM